MVTVFSATPDFEGKDYIVFYGLPGDEKPVGDYYVESRSQILHIANGSVFCEINGCKYYYDAEHKMWL